MKRDGAETRLLHIVSSMAAREDPPCPHFGTCGGCQLQHIPYPQQLSAKAAMLIDVLHDHGVHPVPQIQQHAASPLHYRNRVRFRIEGSEIGYSRRESNEFLAIDRCVIASPLLQALSFTLRDLARSGKAPWPNGAVAFELFTDAEERSVQMSIHLNATVGTVSRDAPQQLRALCSAAQERVTQLAGAGLLAAAPDPQQSRRVQSTQRVEIARWGSQQLSYRVDARDYTITRNSFFQVNRFLTAEMVQVVCDGRSGTLAFDLFAGAGLFSVALAERFRQLIAVEIGEPAASDLREHLLHSGRNHAAVHITTDDFLRGETRKPDLVVLDPPRAGVSRFSLQRLAALQPAEIVYVSCDADTFARDAKALLESGYTLKEFHLFDLFPHTFHTETIAVFRR